MAAARAARGPALRGPPPPPPARGPSSAAGPARQARRGAGVPWVPLTHAPRPGPAPGLLRLAACAASSSDGGSGAVAASPTRTYKVTVRKPMGLVLKEDKALGIVVEQVVEGGNAAKGGDVQAGDILSRVSAVILKSGKDGEFEREGYGQRPYTNWETVMFDCKDQSFDTVMSAISSNNERWGFFTVTMELKRPLKGF